MVTNYKINLKDSYKRSFSKCLPLGMFRKQPRPRTFDYRPRYYDPQKEENKLFSPAEHANQSNLDGMRSRISRHYQSYSGMNKDRNGSTRSQIWTPNLRFVVILLCLMLAAFWFLSANMSKILAFME
jgi:zona occludens toxin (predicted ATPase)